MTPKVSPDNQLPKIVIPSRQSERAKLMAGLQHAFDQTDLLRNEVAKLAHLHNKRCGDLEEQLKRAEDAAEDWEDAVERQAAELDSKDRIIKKLRAALAQPAAQVMKKPKPKPKANRKKKR